MSLTSEQACEVLDISSRHVRNLTKKAVDAGMSFIECKGQKFAFNKAAGIGGRGWVYSYTPIQKVAAKPKRKVKACKVLNPNLLPHIENLDKPSIDEKLSLISFYNASNYPLGHIVNALIMSHNTDIKPASLQTKIKRWAKTFKEKGRQGLEDKRGGKDFKADLDLVTKAIFGAGTRHNRSLYLYYCHLYAEQQNTGYDCTKPSADISESAFNRAVKYLSNTNNHIKEFLRIGQDSFRYSYPSFGNVWTYPCQQWEVDATPLDLMVKIPLDKDGNKDFHSRDVNADYEIVNLSEKDKDKDKTVTKSRVALVRVIDNFSKATVHMITESSNSYANARLLYKAFQVLGKPEVIRSDQGSDYISKHLQGVIQDLAIESIILPPATGNQKGTIERSFRTLQHSALFESLPGFVGHNVSQRQHLENEASTKRDKKSNVATNIKGDFMWHWEAENWIENYLKHVDADKYALHGDYEIDESSQGAIFRTLGKKFTRKVTSQGITHNKIKYHDNELWAKHFVIGEDVFIRENIDDTTKLFVFKTNNEYIGEVTAENIFMQSQTVEQARATQRAYKKRVNKEARKTMHDSQKNFSGLQNKVRDEFLDMAAQSQQAKRELDKNSTHDDLDSEAIRNEIRALAEAAVG